ncbi:MAG TPA: Ger(x)C family spore germination protein [Symbiobacteriaceae bacterium]|jgi:spore germination protein KC
MQLKRAACLLLALVTLFVATGCWDRRELEETGFVLALGVDKGEQSRYAITAMIAIPAKMAGGGKGGGGGGKDKPVLQTTVEAPTIAGAISLIDSYLDRRVSLLHTKALFMAEDLARESGLNTMDEFVRFRQARRTIFYIVTKGKAAAFLKKMDVQQEKDPQRFIEQMTYNSRATAMIPAASQIQQFVTSVNTGYTQPITYYAAIKDEGEAQAAVPKPEQVAAGDFAAGDLPRKGGPNLELFGAAAFRRDRMVGVLTGEEVRYVLLLQDQFQRGYFNIADPRAPGKYVSLDVRRGRPMTIAVDLTGDRPRLDIVVSLEGEILAMQPGIDYTEPEFQPRLEAAAAAEIRRGMRGLVQKTQEWNTDVIGFGSHVVRQFPTVAAWESFKWPEHYQDANVRVEVRMTLRRFGVQLSPPKAAR